MLLPPGLAFLQIQNKDNDDIVVLAPPRPWRQRRCSAAATLISIALNGSRPIVYGTRIGGEGAGPGCAPIAPPRTMNYTNDHRAGAPSPLAATEALCSGDHHRRPLKYEETQQSTCVEATKKNNLLSGSALEQEGGEKGEVWLLLLIFDSSLDDTTTETGRKIETANVV